MTTTSPGPTRSRGPSVRIVDDPMNGPARSYGPVAARKRKGRRKESWVLFGLLGGTTTLALFDLFLLGAGLR